ncbi:MAG: ABC transporter permease [Phycisphaerales bacterium]|nr:ABC transporter permease [Phycisphaerales bacterium]
MLRICWLSLKRDRVALLLSFVLPMGFFSVFAAVFGGAGGGGTSRIRVAVVDEDQSSASSRMVAALERETGLRVRTETGDGASRHPLSREEALALVRGGDLPIAVILLPGFGERFGTFVGGEASVELLADSADPVAGPMVGGLLQKVAMTAAPDLLASRGMKMFEQFGGGLTDQQRRAMDRWLPLLERQAKDSDEAADGATESAGADSGADSSADGGSGFTGPVTVRTVDVLGESKSSGPIAFYAAGTAVMFLLFSMAGAAGTLLEEEEAGTLERLMTSGLGATRLLFGKWAFYALMGMAQITIMFLWARLVFRLELFQHLGGFAVMTAATAAAAAAFGLVLAGLCRTRAQLSGVSTVVILLMSAVGGSMFPRFMMPEWMQTVGLATFNAWALDGYQKVFWYEQPVTSLWPQVLVLVTLSVVFLGVARFLARRWEMA